MHLALAIVLLWIGVALLFVAFHPMQSGSTPGAATESLAGHLANVDNAYGH
jgi:hypothetical protein